MLNLPLLGLPYVQPTRPGVLLLRHGRQLTMVIRIYRFGSLLWASPVLNRTSPPPYVRLIFPERPSKLDVTIFVEADFGPRVSYIAIPIYGHFPTIKEGNHFLLSSKELYGRDGWRHIVAHVYLVTAQIQSSLKRKLKLAFPSSLGAD